MTDAVDLGFIAEQQRRIRDEMRAVRDEMRSIRDEQSLARDVMHVMQRRLDLFDTKLDDGRASLERLGEQVAALTGLVTSGFADLRELITAAKP